VAKPVVDLSHPVQQPPAAHMTGAHSTAPIPKRIDLSQAHTSAAQPAHGLSTATPAASTSHSMATAVGAAGAKGGISGLAVACTFGVVAVVGVGAAVYATDQQTSPSVVSSAPVSTSGSAGDTSAGDNTFPSDNTSPALDPACVTVISGLAPEIPQYNTDSSTLSAAIDSYNSAVDSYNAGETSAAPDDSTVLSDAGAVINDLNSFESTLQGAIPQARDSSVETDLNGMLTGAQQAEQQLQSFANDPTGSGFDTTSQMDAVNTAKAGLLTDCGG
jgi:hypothetical protein